MGATKRAIERLRKRVAGRSCAASDHLDVFGTIAVGIHATAPVVMHMMRMGESGSRMTALSKFAPLCTNNGLLTYSACVLALTLPGLQANVDAALQKGHRRCRSLQPQTMPTTQRLALPST